jgi:uncharacterized protein YidB (DUF937 family)
MHSRTKKAVGAVAFAATLTGGAVGGAMLGIPSVSGAVSPAATSAPTTTAPKSDSGAPERPGPGHHGAGFGFGFDGFDLGAAAKALGISEDELKTRLGDGDTLAEIAKDEGVDVDDVIAALVAAGKKAIDEAAADAKSHLEERITDLVNKGFPERGHGGFPGHGPIRFGLPDLSTLADTLHLTEDQLREKLRSGDSLADIAKAQGIDVDTVVTALVKAASAKIDEAVDDGHLDKDRAAEIKKDLEERIRSFVEDGFPGPGGPWGHRPR